MQVKGGGVQARDIRDLIGTRGVRERPRMGVFITLEPPSAAMVQAAVTAGFYHSPGWNRDYRRLQILTIEELLAGKQVDMPPTNQTFKAAPKAETPQEGQPGLFS